MGRSVSTGTIIHSDMGSVFKSEHYKNAAKRAGLVQSIGNAGLSFVNQMIESFFGKIKTELLHIRSWKSYEEINKVITYYCESFYNAIRPQMILGGRTPLEEFNRFTTCTTTKATISDASPKCLVNISQIPPSLSELIPKIGDLTLSLGETTKFFMQISVLKVKPQSLRRTAPNIKISIQRKCK